jgi:hypothetical protein
MIIDVVFPSDVEPQLDELLRRLPLQGMESHWHADAHALRVVTMGEVMTIRAIEHLLLGTDLDFVSITMRKGTNMAKARP